MRTLVFLAAAALALTYGAASAVAIAPAPAAELEPRVHCDAETDPFANLACRVACITYPPPGHTLLSCLYG